MMIYPDIVVLMFCDISNTREYKLYLKAGLSVLQCIGDFQNAIIYKDGPISNIYLTTKYLTQYQLNFS